MRSVIFPMLLLQGTMKPIEQPWQAIKEWIPDDESNLNWFNQERDSTGAIPNASTKARIGDPQKSRSAMAELWFLIPYAPP